MRAAIDIGGTFTDVLLYDEETGALWASKVPSSAQQPAQAFMSGLHLALASAESELSQVNALVHGTTMSPIRCWREKQLLWVCWLRKDFAICWKSVGNNVPRCMI